MDGLFHGKPYEQMDDLGAKNSIFGNTHMNQQKKKLNFFSKGELQR